MRHEERRLAEGAMGYVDDLRVQAERMRRLAELLTRYGERKFGDDWEPRNPDAVLDESEAEELKDLLRRLQ